MSENYYCLVHKAAFTGLPVVKLFEEEEEAKKVSELFQITSKLGEYSVDIPRLFYGDMPIIMKKVKTWCNEMDFEFSEEDVGPNLIKFEVRVKQ